MVYTAHLRFCYYALHKFTIHTDNEKFTETTFWSMPRNARHTSQTHLVFLFPELLFIEVKAVIDDFCQFGGHL